MTRKKNLCKMEIVFFLFIYRTRISLKIKPYPSNAGNNAALTKHATMATENTPIEIFFKT